MRARSVDVGVPRARLEEHYSGAAEVDPRERLGCVRALSAGRDAATTAVLTKAALRDSSVEVQVAAIEALAKRSGRDVTSTLGVAARDGAAWVRQTAVWALSSRPREEHARVALCAVALREAEDPRTRAQAVQALAQAGDVERLFEIFGRGDGAIRGEAAAGLRGLEYERTAPHLLELVYGCGGLADNVQLQRDALRLLSELRDPAAIRVLGELARGEYPLHELAAELLAQRAEHEAECSCRGNAPGTAYYTSVRNDSGNYRALTGPWQSHEEALADVDRARDLALEAGDPRAHWYGYGTMAAKPGAPRIDALFPLPAALLERSR